MNQKVISRESPIVLARLIHKTIQEYAAKQEHGTCIDQIDEALNLVREGIAFEKINFVKDEPK